MHRDDFASDKPPTRGQWEEIAKAWCVFHGEIPPTSRMDATTLLTRLRAATPPDQWGGADVVTVDFGSRGGVDGHMEGSRGPGDEDGSTPAA